MKKKFLRIGLWAAMLALGLSGAGWAAEYTWTGGGGDGRWTTPGNWNPNTGYPQNDDTAVFTQSAAVKPLGAGGGGYAFTLGSLVLAGDITLDFQENSQPLEVKELVVRGGKPVFKSSGAAGKFILSTGLGGNARIRVPGGASLTLEERDISGAGALHLTGGGRLTLKAAVTNVTDLKIEDGSTLDVQKANALPGVTAPTVTVTIEDGSLVVGEGDLFTSAVTTLVVRKGDLTLKKPLREELKGITVGAGTLTVEPGGNAGNDDAVLTLGRDSVLNVKRTLTLKGLVTAPGGGGRIAIAQGKNLTVKPESDMLLELPVTGGGLFLWPESGKTATLKKPVAHVSFSAAPNTILKLDPVGDALFGRIDFNFGGRTLHVAGDARVGRLSYENGNALPVTFAAGKKLTVDTIVFNNNPLQLQGVGAGTLEVMGDLIPIDGAGSGTYKITVGNGHVLKLHKPQEKEGTITLEESSHLELASGQYPESKLSVTGDAVLAGPAIDSIGNSPLLSVKEIDVAAGKTLKVLRPQFLPRPLKAGETITLLKAGNTSGTGTIVGDPADQDGIRITWDSGEKALRLTAQHDVVVPKLSVSGQVSGTASRRIVTVLSDVDVDPASWSLEAPRGDAVVAVISRAPRQCVFTVEPAAGSAAPQLRASAKVAGSPLSGTLSFPLPALPGGGGGGGGGDGNDGRPPVTPAPGHPEVADGTWIAEISSPDAQGNVTVSLDVFVSCDLQPTAVEVESYEGMTEKPAGELWHEGKRILTFGTAPQATGAKTYLLRLVCRTTTADIESGRATIRRVLLKTSQATHTLDLNKRIKDVEVKKPDAPQPKPQPQPQPDPEKRGSSGGGCDTGFAGLALLLATPLFFRRKD